MQLKERTDAMELMIESIDKEQHEFKLEYDEVNFELNQMEQESRAKNLPAMPGLKIQKMLETWDEYEPMDMDEFKKYSTELWLSLA